MWVNNNPWDELHQEKKREYGSDKSSQKKESQPRIYYGLCCLYSGIHILKPPISERQKAVIVLTCAVHPYRDLVCPLLAKNRLQLCLALEHCVCCVLFIYLYFLMFDHILLCRQSNKHTFGITPITTQNYTQEERYVLLAYLHNCPRIAFCERKCSSHTHTHTESALSPSSLSLL